MDFVQHITWRPEIGDPSLMGWVTVAAYGLAAVAALARAATVGRLTSNGKGSRGTWLLVAVLMAFLCINKQLDLQSLLTDIGRAISRTQGWYEGRREVQRWFVVVVLAVAAVTTAVLARRYREFWRTHLLLASGLAFLLTFIVVRAISFHHVDEFLGLRVAGVRMNWFLELTGIALILAAAVWDSLSPGGMSTDQSPSRGSAS